MNKNEIDNWFTNNWDKLIDNAKNICNNYGHHHLATDLVIYLYEQIIKDQHRIDNQQQLEQWYWRKAKMEAGGWSESNFLKKYKIDRPNRRLWKVPQVNPIYSPIQEYKPSEPGDNCISVKEQAINPYEHKQEEDYNQQTERELDIQAMEAAIALYPFIYTATTEIRFWELVTIKHQTSKDKIANYFKKHNMEFKAETASVHLRKFRKQLNEIYLKLRN